MSAPHLQKPATSLTDQSELISDVIPNIPARPNQKVTFPFVTLTSVQNV